VENQLSNAGINVQECGWEIMTNIWKPSRAGTVLRIWKISVKKLV